ncbi:MAG: sigma factor-like helix-turn-helix DNA-binding protein [Solirubrobacteraceae bacterium]|nr:sigma factor-like helix-turn-helix DNA-binding protein [Solirubrobacteraceae bacterium]
MPYVSCEACELRFHAVATHSTVARCPSCDAAIDGDDERALRGARASAGSAVHTALDGHALVLLTFFVRRALEAEAGIALWAETVAHAHLAARRLRTSSEAVGWLDAMAYRQLARFRATGRTESRALRRLGLCPPVPAAEEIVGLDVLAGLPALRSEVARRLALLPEGTREIVRLCVVEGHPTAAVAAQVGISQEDVRRQVSNSLRAVAHTLARPPAPEAIDGLPSLAAWLAAARAG